MIFPYLDAFILADSIRVFVDCSWHALGVRPYAHTHRVVAAGSSRSGGDGRASRNAGGERAALIYPLIETCKLNGLDPYADLGDVLARIADHSIKRVDELLPFNLAAVKNGAD
jgi:hypothetical protein